MEFFDDLKGRNFTPASIKAYMEPLTHFFTYLAAGAGSVKRLQDVTLEDVEAYRLRLVRRNLSGNTVETYLRAVRMLFRHLEKRGHVFSDPVLNLAVPRPEKRLPDVPTVEEMNRLLAAPDITTPMGIRDRAIIEVLYSTGVRRGELLGMTVFSADLRNRTLRVFGKGRKERVVPLGKQGCLWLKAYLSEARSSLLKGKAGLNALWVTANRTAMGDGAVLQMLRRYARQAGVRRICPHAIRRACATHMLASGAHPVQLQMLLGHETLGTLSKYLLVAIPELKRTHRRSRLGR